MHDKYKTSRNNFITIQQSTFTSASAFNNCFISKKKDEYKVTVPKQTVENKCNCTADAKCNLGCLNKALLVECDRNTCSSGNACTNMKFQSNARPAVTIRETKNKGFGLFAEEDIAADALVIEYIGEVIDNNEYELRQARMKPDDHVYFVKISFDTIIDNTTKGNNARFVNHSCEPNCVMQKWNVNHEQRIGLFSIRSITKGEELTFDYNSGNMSLLHGICKCGTSKCRQLNSK